MTHGKNTSIHDTKDNPILHNKFKKNVQKSMKINFKDTDMAMLLLSQSYIPIQNTRFS